MNAVSDRLFEELGTFDGSERQDFQEGEFKVDLRIGNVRFDPGSGEEFIDLELVVRYPAKGDRTVRAELPRFAAERLVEAVEDAFEQFE